MKTINLIKNPQNLGEIRRIPLDSANRIISQQSQESQGNSRGSILDEKSGLCSHEREDRTLGSSTKRVAKQGEAEVSLANSPIYHQKTNARAGFGMMFAIILTILVAGLGILGLKFSTQTLNTTTNEYIAIQLDLYANSTAELAILHIQRNGFICEENVDCDLGVSNLGGAGKRKDRTAPIEKYITYGPNSEYKFTYKMTPLDNYDKYDPTTYMQNDDLEACEATLKAQGGNQRCYNIKEETKNAFILDIAGSVTNPLTNQTLRVTKRQVIKP